MAESVEKTLGLPEGACAGCPFEGVYQRGVTGGHLAELLNARLLVADEHLTWADALGRELVAADVDALGAWKQARARFDLMALRERERARAEAEKNRNRK